MREKNEGDDRSEQRANGVHGTVHAEGERERRRLRAERNNRIARRGACAFACAIERDDGGDPAPGRAGGEQEKFADGRKAVAEKRDFFRPTRPVGDQSTGQTQNRDGESIIDAVDRAELHWTHVQMQNNKDRQQAVHHFRRNVGEQAGEPESPDGRMNAAEFPGGRIALTQFHPLDPIKTIHDSLGWSKSPGEFIEQRCSCK